ncbi:bleomycin hydrolase [Ascoidea rubescens DSM 1968]|uniref:Cysteine proteinase 1, mitochondrial n=1 Tax=Ascoidea rubescens DSM 1968 TaxID=1344418 RepID=A0A1D2VI32_9ASCO|nr:cysteine proteinase 1, mitochondrial [Ascoidea rubescens DSM 1968]ODV61127.1 cysteine proteinase 1, mitochondrial [Ascoidea rubescens DSM 1968]
MADQFGGISISSLKSWDKDFKADSTTQLASRILTNADPDEILVDRNSLLKNYSNVFSNKIKVEGSPITNQKSSGRCWLFAATNILRIPLITKYNLKEFQLSPTYIFFYDKLEKSNFFLQQIISTYKEPVDSRLVQHLLSDPVSDGGQFDMFINVIKKYGIVPNTIFPDTFSSTASRKLNSLITTKLREFAEILRGNLEKDLSVEELVIDMQKDIYRLLTLFLGTPPKPNDEFTWEFYDKDSNYSGLTFTPLSFFNDIINKEFNITDSISLLNDPRNPYENMIKIDRLGNVFGSKIVSYLNLDISILTKVLVDRIKNNKPVFFGSHTPMYMHKKLGVMDIQLWDYKVIGFKPKQLKASRLIYHQSLMTHAMVITAVHIDPNTNKPVRYRVENSWGETTGIKGYYIMTQEYFEEYCYQIVCDREDIKEYLYLLEKEPIVLPPYDPCGSLAICGKTDINL